MFLFGLLLAELNMIAIGHFVILKQRISECEIIIGPDKINKLIRALEILPLKSIYVMNYKIYAETSQVTFIFNLVPYESMIDALNDRELGSDMAAFDGKQIYFNAEGKFAMETGYNIINLKKCNRNTMNTIKKYEDRGFGILHTDLSESNKFKLCCIYKNLDDFDILDNLIAGINYFNMSTTIDEIKTGTVQLKLDSNM
jgi:hypothetical protein